MKNSDFCHLHVHNEYSILDGYGSADSYVKRAAELGFNSLGLTNHGNIDGLIAFQKACDKEHIHPVMGCEAYIVENPEIKMKGEIRRHITLLIKNETGFSNLCRMLTEANLTGFYYKPRIGFDSLLAHCDGLVILSGCSNSFLHLENGEEFARSLHRKIGQDFYLEIMPHCIEGQIQTNEICCRLNKELGIELVATNDCHFILSDDREVHEVLLAIQTKAKWSDQNRLKFDVPGLHLRTVSEMIDAFKEQGIVSRKEYTSAILQTMEIVEKCKDFRIQKKDIFLPTVPGYEGIDCSGFLWNECEKKLLEKSEEENWDTDKINLYFERLSEEWKLINQKKFAPYFMIVWELIQWCKKSDILTGPGRGSVGGSLVAYFLEITCVDPIQFGLLFSRFISEDRIDFPDIDIDFEDRKRHLVREHLEALYGTNNVSSISTFLSMKGRAAIRDVGRVFDIPARETDVFAKTIEAIEDDDEDSISKAVKSSEVGKQYYSRYKKQVEIAIKLEGQIRGNGQHAAGIIISADDLSQGARGNLVVRSGQTVINWGMTDSEFMGLMKLDVLGLNALSILSETKRLIEENTGKEIVLEKIPLDDQKVFKEISEGNNTGVFQLNTWMASKLAKQIKCTNIHEWSDIIALIRPGPSDSGMTNDYISRKHSKKKRKIESKEYESIVKDTYGIIVYQEQIMEVIYKIAGLSYSIADKIRKIISKQRNPKEFLPFKKIFIEGCKKEKIFSEKQANAFWEMLQSHARYSFNFSHSIEYAILGYWTAWCKYYYPTEFICANLSFGSEGKKEEIINEAYRMGLDIALPKIGISDPLLWKAKDKVLYVPLIEIKGIGEKLAISAKPRNEEGDTKEEQKEKQVKIVTIPAQKTKGFFFSPKSTKTIILSQKNKTQLPKKSKIHSLIDEIHSLKEQGKISELSKYFSFPIKENRKDNFQALREKIGFDFPKNDLDSLLSLSVPRNHLGKLIKQ